PRSVISFSPVGLDGLGRSAYDRRSMTRRWFVLAVVAMLLAAVPAMADEDGHGPSQPSLLPVPDTVTSLPLTLAWTPSTFTPGSLQNGYEISVQDRTADTTQVVDVPAPAGPGAVTASVPLINGHSYRLRVRGVETICAGRSGDDCRVVAGGFGKEERTQGLPAPAPPSPTPLPLHPPPPPRLPPPPPAAPGHPALALSRRPPPARARRCDEAGRPAGTDRSADDPTASALGGPGAVTPPRSWASGPASLAREPAGDVLQRAGLRRG